MEGNYSNTQFSCSFSTQIDPFSLCVRSRPQEGKSVSEETPSNQRWADPGGKSGGEQRSMGRGPGNLTTKGKAEKLSQPRWQEVSSGPLALLIFQAGNAASPTADEDKAPDPSASSL
ncbi:unnamed protein product [Rangifer tarandus platyrhynchus]|uniref:Uncharacterized protein n=3 Tax=Rangifer tarandus platyrhynchus TaxID=3082113 RepID=A0ACB0FM56_RANTA|nr:unnamed protein product [Rangifer tarandus platyrhynchus]CAI9714167.1 unnamed protein product [Rangifer tarandus platyrhynchus]